MNKSPIILVLMLNLVISVGCAKSDWIQSTLVTVDVTGTWRAATGDLELTLQQEGSRITGIMRRTGGSNTVVTSEGQIRGAVAGDVVQWQQTGLGDPMGCQGEMTASGDEMTGKVTCAIGAQRSGVFHLRRIDSSPPPRSR
jgi:hypothetical protein